MSDTTYLTTEKLSEITSVSKNVDPTLIEPFIETSQEFYIVPVLGDALHSELIGEIEDGTLSGNNETLVDEYILPVAAFYCWYDAVPFLAFKTHNKGIVRQGYRGIGILHHGP